MFRILVIAVLGELALVQAASGQSGSSEPASMDQAIALLDEARRQFKDVRDYECELIKRERVNGKLMPESAMIMKVHTRPLSIYLHIDTPKDDEGMEVCYVAGRNDGMMRVHPNGATGVLGFWSIDLNDKRALEKNRHHINEAGLGNLLESTARYWDMERRLNKTQVQITEGKIRGRTCTRIETIHPDRDAGSFYAYRCVLWLDNETHLPVGAEAYDWPRRGGSPDGELLEFYRFLDLRCNVGLPDKTFAH